MGLSGSLPHARGGVSSGFSRFRSRTKSSPRPWGCFFVLSSSADLDKVFPTPVGVFLYVSELLKVLDRLPHARGGVSEKLTEIGAHEVSSPRPWGCFRARSSDGLAHIVFPTPVGVFLALRLILAYVVRLPHARGGVSTGVV